MSVRGAQASLRGGKLEVFRAQALEERTYRLHVSHRVGVEDDHVVELVNHLF